MRQQLTALREIGYANNVRRGERDYHVQTEIMTFRDIKIKTTIHLKGTLVDALAQVVEVEQDLIRKVKDTAIRQHNGAVESVRLGKYD